MKMKSRRLRHSVTLQREAPTSDGGYPQKNWATYATTRASIMPKTGKEYETSNRMLGEEAVTFAMRGSTSYKVQAGDRILFDGGVYQVEAALDFQELNRDITVMAVKRSDGL